MTDQAGSFDPKAEAAKINDLAKDVFYAESHGYVNTALVEQEALARELATIWSKQPLGQWLPGTPMGSLMDELRKEPGSGFITNPTYLFSRRTDVQSWDDHSKGEALYIMPAFFTKGTMGGAHMSIQENWQDHSIEITNGYGTGDPQNPTLNFTSEAIMPNPQK